MYFRSQTRSTTSWIGPLPDSSILTCDKQLVTAGKNIGSGILTGMDINWVELAQLCRERGTRSYGSAEAMIALEIIIGEDTIRKAVDYYIDLKPEHELARQVLWRLRPPSGMARCYDIFKSDTNLERRRSAVELLRVIADRRVLPWIEEFWADPDPGIQNWGAGVLDQLLWGGGMDANGADYKEVERLIDHGETHPNPGVRELMTFIRKYLADRQEQQK